jgi:hypothetical protein
MEKGMGFNQLIKIIGRTFFPVGYRNKKGLFYCKMNDIIKFIEIERGWIKEYNLSFGVYIDELGTLDRPPKTPAIHCSHLWALIQQVIPDREQRVIVIDALDLSKPIKDTVRENIIKYALNHYVLPLLEQVDTFDKIVTYCCAGNFERKLMPSRACWDILKRRTGKELQPKFIPLTPEQERQMDEQVQQEEKEFRRELESEGYGYVEMPKIERKQFHNNENCG